MGTFSTSGVYSSKDVRGRTANNHHGYPAKVEVELLALKDCIAGCVK